MNQNKLEIAKKLQTKDPKQLNMVLGFDGFVDEIIHVVDKRQDSEHFTRIETLLALAKRIEKASGLSTNIELLPTVKKIGGNGPIMCNALSKHEPTITYIGALGNPNIHEVFMEMEPAAKLFTIAENGHTDALEFLDGKLMLGKMDSLKDVNYERLLEVVGKKQLIKLLSELDLFAAVNWSMLPKMTELWKKMITEILPQLPKRNNKPILFIDLADPEKREHDEIIEIIDLLKQFNPYFRVILGLNKKEAYDVAGVLNLFESKSLKDMTVSLEDLNQALYRYASIYGIVIHPVDRSCTVIDGIFYQDFGPFCAKPVLTTGAGDNFNSGYVLGLLLGLEPDEALVVGMATSGFYVRNARSPKYQELIQFIERWANNQID
jgi:hypothetical protein